MADQHPNFIQKAIKHPGAFGQDAQQHGMSTAAFAQKEEHAPGKEGFRARLAQTLMNLHKK